MDRLVLKLDGRDRAARVARVARIIVRERVDAVRAEHGRDWSDREAYDDHVSWLRGLDARVDGDKVDPVVVIRPYWQPRPGYGAGTAASILDAAVVRVEDSLGERVPCQIADVDGGGASVQWERKPNLERWHAYLGSWPGRAPMVAVDFEGRTFYLNWDAQHMAVYVANRFAFRHGVGRMAHAHNLLLLAKHLRVDTYTVSRLVMVVAWDHCGVSVERNQALRILSEDEERAVTASGVRVHPVGARS
jgi:hypothetical protein